MKLVSTLLEKKLRLYIRKTSLIGKLFSDKPHYIFHYNDFNLLRAVIAKEISLNKKLLKYIKAYAETNSKKLESFVIEFEKITRSLIRVLQQELKVLRKLSVPNLLWNELDVLFLRRSKRQFFEVQFSKFNNLHHKEQVLDAKLFIIASQEKKSLVANKVKNYNKLAKDISKQYKLLASSIGNTALVKANARELLKLFKKLQGTEIYAYMQDDIVFIKDNVKNVIKDPNQSKVKTVLATAYMFAPGTFEATAYILLAKNLTKVTLSKLGVKKRKKNPKEFYPKPKAA